MDKHTVLVLASPTEPQLAMLHALPPGTEVLTGAEPGAFARAAADATVILSWSIGGELLRGVWRQCGQVRWVHSRAAGLDTMLFPELVASPVPLTNGSGVFSQSLAEFFIGATLFFAKDFRRMLRSQAAGVWDQFEVEEVAGKVVTVVGYGDIGRACAVRARALGMKVLAVKRHPLAAGTDPLVDRCYGPDRLGEAVAQADYVLAAAPLTAETKGMLGERQFAAMKPSAVVVNVGRGPVIDEAAMLRALASRRIKGAALDVFEREPLPAGHPFYTLDNVLLSPHCADHTADWLERAMQFFLDQFERFRTGQPLRNVVRKDLGY